MRMQISSTSTGGNDWRTGGATLFVRETDEARITVSLSHSDLGKGLTEAIVFPGGTSLAISGGVAYFLNGEVEAPAQQLGVEPVQCIAIRNDGSAAALSDFTKICLVSQTGVCWTSERVSYDGIRGLRIVDDEILAEGYNAPLSDEAAPIALECATGRVIRSAYP
jgi:hypothetical protein